MNGEGIRLGRGSLINMPIRKLPSVVPSESIVLPPARSHSRECRPLRHQIHIANLRSRPKHSLLPNKRQRRNRVKTLLKPQKRLIAINFPPKNRPACAVLVVGHRIRNGHHPRRLQQATHRRRSRDIGKRRNLVIQIHLARRRKRLANHIRIHDRHREKVEEEMVAQSL